MDKIAKIGDLAILLGAIFTIRAHLFRNEHPRSQDYIGTLDDLKMRLEKPILFARADKGSLSERNLHYLRAQIIWVSLR